MVSCDASNHGGAPQISVVPLSSKLKDNPVHVIVEPSEIRGYALSNRSDFMPEDIQTLNKGCVRFKSGYIPGESEITIDNIHTVLHQVLQLAVEDNYIRQNISDNLLKELKSSHHYEDAHRRALTIPEQELFLDFLSDESSQYYHWFPIFTVMVGTGMRVGEVTGLRWEDIDLDTGMIDVNHTLAYYKHRDENGCYFSIHSPKTRAGKRQIPMTEDVKNAFLLEKEMQELSGTHSNVTVDGYQNFIFVNRFGGVQHQGSLNKALRRIIRDCNDKQFLKEKKNLVLLPNFTCHLLRHTFTTRLVEAGVNIKVIQNLCGHSRSDVTLDIYTTVTKELKQAEFDDFQKKLKEKKQEWKNRQEEDA